MSWFLDCLAVFFIVLLGAVGFKRGFIEELGRLIGLILAILIAMSNSLVVSNRINDFLPTDQWVGLFISFSLLFAATLIAARVLTKFVHIALLSKSNHLMNRSLGFLFGSTKGFFIIMVFVWLITILPLQKWSNIIVENSRIAQKGNQYRESIITFFNWEDPVAMSESYFKQLTQP